MESLYTMSDKIIDEILLQVNSSIFNKIHTSGSTSITKELYNVIQFRFNDISLRMLDKDTILEATLDDS